MQGDTRVANKKCPTATDRASTTLSRARVALVLDSRPISYMVSHILPTAIDQDKTASPARAIAYVAVSARLVYVRPARTGRNSFPAGCGMTPTDTLARRQCKPHVCEPRGKTRLCASLTTGWVTSHAMWLPHCTDKSAVSSR